MSIDRDTVARVARLARIRINPEEVDSYQAKLASIMKFVEQLDEVNTDQVEPLSNVADVALRLREDAVTDGNIQQEVLANAPEALEGFFVVPKVVE